MARKVRNERQYDERGVVREMARADGWVMVRRPGCIPFVLPAKQFDALPLREG